MWSIVFSRRSIWVLLELVGRWTSTFPKSTIRPVKLDKFIVGTPWLLDLLCKHWFVSSVWKFCRWVADDQAPRQTSPAAKSEEKRMFSQASFTAIAPKSSQKITMVSVLWWNCLISSSKPHRNINFSTGKDLKEWLRRRIDLKHRYPREIPSFSNCFLNQTNFKRRQLKWACALAVKMTPRKIN